MSVPTAPTAAGETAAGGHPGPAPEPADPQARDLARRVARAAAELVHDAADAVLIERLHQAGIRPILLKGPVTAHRLYPGEYRPRADCDLLVASGRLAAARAVAVAAGYCPREPSPHAQAYCHPNGQVLDLHWTLPVVSPPAERVWATLSRHRVAFALGGTAVDALDLPAHAFHLLVHTAGAPARSSGARRDLDRAVAAFDLATWRGALEVADELDARAAVIAALRTGSPACWRLADELGLPVRVPFTWRLWLADQSLLLNAQLILRSASPQRRRTILRRWLVPTRAELAGWSARPEVQAATPAALPPAARLLWYRVHQLALFSVALRRATRQPAAPRPAPAQPGSAPSG
ncbi:nucleotidyltransferase family protein [Frankia sp. AgB1.9]|uniref:nucleotidyltransferase family protein n=1 Tax=unclassified Frankia TaxID=2632575 RepID=UPI001932AF8F|nr:MULTISPECIES: nucleotidyltransferase family protein [unclassified Frankia]MBL7491215.1 nucleotidyltransferase family protein [Frankia sp. AgW1.1]MBL7548180.1 nucleotidyltransferase family protein [Frankia sp. AgB1.9]MBL7618426.1 nucleotidyltransferase family protein [Frankia sp. AgB1.8]